MRTRSASLVHALPPIPLTPNPESSTLNPQPSTINPQPSAINPQPSTLNLQPSTHQAKAAELQEANEDQAAPPPPRPLPSKQGTTSTIFKNFYLKAKACIWSSLPDMCHVHCATAARLSRTRDSPARPTKTRQPPTPLRFRAKGDHLKRFHDF